MRISSLKLVYGLIVGVGVVAFLWRDTFDPDSLSGTRVLVTGASTGIGEQIAYHYARFGAQIVLTARREAVLQKVVEKCLELGAKNAVYFPADMSSLQEAEKLVQFTLKHLGGLDYVVLNHIGFSPFEMWDGDMDYLQWIMKVNFFSYVAIAKATLPALVESRGSLVVVSSFLGKVGSPFVAPYSSTKFALEGFFESLRHELVIQEKDVSITVCVLGLIDTETVMNKIRGKYSFPSHPASEAALAIVKGGAARDIYVYYPWPLELVSKIRDWSPALQHRITRAYFNYYSTS